MGRSQRRSSGCIQERREAGDKRNTVWRALAPADQLKAIDKRLGKGVGATRQRAKLAEKLNPPKPEPKPEVPVEVFASKSEEKRVKTLRKHARHANGEKS